MDRNSSNTRDQRDSISTLDSERSQTSASSIFSITRSDSRASTNTAYSEHSLLSTNSYLSPAPPRIAADRRAATHAFRATSDNLRNDPRRAALRTATQLATSRRLGSPAALIPKDHLARHTTPLNEKQASNKYACSHCPEVFTKKSDRKKHWHHRCQYLGDPNTSEAIPGDGFVCSACDHVARNAFQQCKHQQMSGHQGPCDPVRMCAKQRFTCSTHGTIFHSARDFFAHFDRDACPLNHHSGGKDGDRHHHARIITLLQEGRDGRHGNHTYLYAALSSYCSAHWLRKDDWHAIVQDHSTEEALALANKLEWGLQDPDGSAISRLGFTDLLHMVALIVPVPNDGLRDVSDAEDNSGLSDHQTAASTTTRHVEHPSRTELSDARFVRRMEKNIAQIAMLQPPSPIRQRLRPGDRHQSSGFSVHMTQPLSYPDIEAPDFYYSEPVPAVHSGPSRLDHSGEIEDSWLCDLGAPSFESLEGEELTIRTRDMPDGRYEEMAVVENATPLFLPRTAHVDFTGSPGLCAPAGSASGPAWDYPERAALTPSPPSVSWLSPPATHQQANRKRPISNNSAIIPASEARSKYGPVAALVHRPVSKDLSEDTPTMSYLSSFAQRSSGDSMVSEWFNYKQYYDQPPTPASLLPGTKATSCNERATPEPKASHERSRTAGQAMKDMMRKMKNPTPCEMTLMPITRKDSRLAPSSSQCVHCGNIVDVTCLTRHIEQQVKPRHNRRKGSVLDPAEVTRAFQDIDQEHRS